MFIDEVREICLSLPCVEECQPFLNCGSDIVAFKVGGRVFAMLAVDTSRTVLMKCDPDYAIDLRDEYVGVVEPAWHCNKRHWNQVHYDSPRISADFLRQLITHAYDETKKKLTRRQREALEGRQAD